jgi:hypothetical protein
MSAIPGKRDFLCEVAGGIEVFMNCSMLSDEIHAGQDEDIEVYIKNNILEGPSFSTEKFCKAMQTIDDKTLRDLLYYFDDRDMSMVEAYNESCLGLDDLPQELTDIAEAILDQDILTFTDFLEY